MSAPSEATRTIFLVQRWHWRVLEDDTEEVAGNDPRQDVQPHPDYPGTFRLVNHHRSPDEGAIPVRAFLDHARAEAFRREQEQARRACTNPFRYGSRMEDRTSLDDGRLRDWLLDASLTPPGAKGEEKPARIQAAWRGWWASVRERLTEKQREGVARVLNDALLGYAEYQHDRRNDLAWLDEHLDEAQRLTKAQRQQVRMGLLGSGVYEYPKFDGEHDNSVVQEKWRAWWDRHHPIMTPLQRHSVWEALDKVRFFEVIELVAPNVS